MDPVSSAEPASLVVVGLGINAFGQLTVEAIAHMKNTEKLLCLCTDPVGEEVARSLNPNGFESLLGFYEPGKDRMTTYKEILDAILKHVRAGTRTCVAVYGHPGVFAWPTHQAVKVAREENYRAEMLPAVSSLDCLFADLGLDPGTDGLLCFEATDFLMRARQVDPTVLLVLLQVGFLGNRSTPTGQEGPPPSLPLLVDRLCKHYPSDHPVIVYEAGSLPGVGPSIQRLPLSCLPDARLSPASTLVVLRRQEAGFDEEMVRRMDELQQARGTPGTGPNSCP
jgi:hypothetical protein